MISPRVLSLLKVYETGSFTKAASFLGRTQPAVSQHIYALESELGVTIFDRSHSPLTVTPEGMYVINSAKKIVEASNELEETLIRYRNGARTMHVGLTSSEELYGITSVISDVLLEDDDLSIETARYVYDNMVSMLYKGEIDVAVAFGNIDVSSDYGRKVLDHDRLMLAVSKDNPLASMETVSLGNLVEEKLVTFPSSTGIGRYVEHAISSSELDFKIGNVRLVTYELESISRMVESGKASAIVPEKVFAPIQGKETLLIPVDEFKDEIPLNLYFNVASGFSKTIDEILEKYKAE